MRMCTQKGSQDDGRVPQTLSDSSSFFSSHPFHFCLSSSAKTLWTYGPHKPAVSPCKHILYRPNVGQQGHWTSVIRIRYSFSNTVNFCVHLILSFCLHPFIISPQSLAFVRNQGRHLPSVPPAPSSFSSQQPDHHGGQSGRLWKGMTLFACESVHICVAMCVCRG